MIKFLLTILLISILHNNINNIINFNYNFYEFFFLLLIYVINKWIFHCFRNCLLNFYQNISKGVLKYIKETIIPSKPKKPISPFLLYVKDISLKIKQEKPDTKYSEILKKASRGWAELNPVEKENFTKEYIKNYEIYTKQLKEYNNSITDEQKQLWEEKKKEYENSNKKINSKQVLIMNISNYMLIFLLIIN